MYKEHEFILLPSGKAPRFGQIVKDTVSNKLVIASRKNLGNKIFDAPDFFDFVNGNYVSMEVYIISDDKNFSTSDWVLENNVLMLFNSKRIVEKCVKVVATTRTDIDLPKLSDIFIDKFIASDNEGNMVSSILVEYYPIANEFDNPMTNPLGLDNFEGHEEEILINPDNTINIGSLCRIYEKY